MNNTMRNIKFAGCLFIIVIGASCTKWLDVKPKTEIATNDLFKEEAGFKEALAGTYTAMAQPSLYTKNTTYRILDAMAQYWLLTSGDTLFDAQIYNYESIRIKPQIDAIWDGLYNVIANANNILDHIDMDKSVFKGDNYNIIKGEALAIRAFAHFDILRMYAPANFSTSTGSIPYVTSFSKLITREFTAKEVVDLCIKDLEAAAELLKVDPIYTGEKITVEMDKGYLLNRFYHLNYYAVKGLQARIYLYSGAKPKALEAALEVIQAQSQKNIFPWVKSDDVSTSQSNLRDRTFSSEHLFALNSKKMVEIIAPSFKSGNTLLKNKQASIKTSLYEGFTDYRSTYLFETVGASPEILSKFWQETGATKRDRMPMIRISEMYYIAAECNSANIPVALGYLNAVRQHRGIIADLPGTINELDLMNEIQKEYKKEFIGEGQLFFYHKRRQDATIEGVKPNYIFPMPDVEIEYGNRN